LSGWIALALLGLTAGAALIAVGLRRPLWMGGAAALMLGAAGYATQARPGLPPHPARPVAGVANIDEEASALRLAMFGRHTYAEQMFIVSDGLIRAGAPRSAVNLLLGAVASQPTSIGSWTALGQAYAITDGDTVSPASRFAFDQAMRIAPWHAGPPFFLGLAYLRAGDAVEARAWWVRSLARAPAGTRYREQVAERLMLLDQLMAMGGGR
jgi:hypothetical protein